MTVQAANVQRDVRNIRDCKTHDELDGYEAEAKRRGIDQWETAAIVEMRAKIGKLK